MKKSFILIIAMFLVAGLSAQNTKTLKVIQNSKAVFQQGIRLADQGKMDEAIQQYEKIPYGDPMYDDAQYEKAYVYEMQEKYTAALNILNELAKDPSTTVPHVNIYTELGNCYDYLEQYDKAVEMYNKGLENHPYYYHLHFNKGVSLMRQEKYEEALECFKTSIFLCPAHQGSHFQYGHCYLLLGYTMPGILALNYSILINPTSNYAILALRELDNIYEGGIAAYNSDNKVYVEQQYKEKNKFYEEASTALNLAIISPKSVKCPSKIDYPLVKNNYVVLSHINVRPNSNEIEDQIYAPFFQKILADKEYNSLSYYQFGNTDLQDGKIAKKAEKMQKEIEAVQQKLINQLDDICAKGIGKVPSDTLYVYDNYKLSSWGIGSRNSNGKVQREGTWHFIDPSGQLSSIDQYEHNILHGHHQSFNNNQISEEFDFEHGKPTGIVRSYNHNPLTKDRILTMEADIQNGKLSGNYKQYNQGGILTTEGHTKDGAPEGELRNYYETGQIYSIEHYADQDYAGLQQYFYPNGQIQSEYTVGASDETTDAKLYYPNGKVQKEGFVKNQKPVGANTVRYPNGVLQETLTLNDKGNLEGEDIEYFRNGNIYKKYNYKDGQTDGECTEYGIGGHPIVKYTYNNGTLVSVTTFNPDNSVRETYPVKNKSVTYDVYDENGHLAYTATSNAKGLYEGSRKTYYSNGNICQETNFKDGLMNGIYKQYTASGSLLNYAEIKNNARNGLSIDYYTDDAHHINKESLYRNDTLIGASYTYYPDGSLNMKECYDDNGDMTYYAHYLPDGKITREIRYYQGMPLLTFSYDKDGNIIHCDTTLFGNGHNSIYSLSGKMTYYRTIKAGKREGQNITYNINGEAIDTTFYLNGTPNGIARIFHPTGEIYQVTNSYLKKDDGKFRTFDPLGQMMQEVTFEMGNAQGPWTVFYPNSKIAEKGNCIQDNKEGTWNFYDPMGKTILFEADYYNGELFQFSSLQQNGQMSRPVAIDKEAQSATATYPNGKTALVANLEQGLLHGSWVVYYTNGQAAESAEFKNGKLDGTYIFYYPNGKICKRANYHNGLLHGTYELYYENGQKAYEGNYYYDLSHGDFKAYDKTGKLTHKVTMYYDETMSDEKY